MAPDVWIDKAGYTAAGETVLSLAHKWGVNPSSIYRIVKKKRFPSGEMMVRFFVESGGKVTLADWIKFSKPSFRKLGLKPKGKVNGRRH